jgi:hypothetical protein
MGRTMKMSLKKEVYEQKDTKKWLAELNDFETPVVSHINVAKNTIWQGVFDSKEEAEEATQKEWDKRMGRMGILKRRYAHSSV